MSENTDPIVGENLTIQQAIKLMEEKPEERYAELPYVMGACYLYYLHSFGDGGATETSRLNKVYGLNEMTIRLWEKGPEYIRHLRDYTFTNRGICSDQWRVRKIEN